VDNLWITCGQLFKPAAKAPATNNFDQKPKKGVAERPLVSSMQDCPKSYPQVIHRLSTGYPQLYPYRKQPTGRVIGSKNRKLSTKRGPLIIIIFIYIYNLLYKDITKH
jgi:hypothetical protein